MNDVDLGHQLEVLGGEMARTAAAARTVDQCAGLRSGERDQLPD
jgi:hypothetical protein